MFVVHVINQLCTHVKMFSASTDGATTQCQISPCEFYSSSVHTRVTSTLQVMCGLPC